MIKTQTAKSQLILSICFLIFFSINLKAQIKFTPKQHLMNYVAQTIADEDLAFAKQFREKNIDNNFNSSQLPSFISDKKKSSFRNGNLTDVLDSIIYTNEGLQFKNDYLFDENGNNTSILFHAQDTISGAWEEYGKFINTFDNKGNQLTSYAELFDSSTAMWNRIAFVTNTYDSHGNQLTLVQEGLNASGNWVNMNSKDYTYDDNNNRLSAIESNWDPVTQTWKIGYGGFFTIDDMGNVLAAVYKYWNGAIWQIIFRYQYTYDDDYYLISVANNKFDPADSSWLDNTLISYINDENGAQKEVVNYVYNGSNWINVNKTIYTYDEDGNRTIGLGQTWNNTDWINSGKQTFTYDDNNNFLSFLLQEWNDTISEWGNILLFNYTYTACSNLKNFNGKKWDGSEWKFTDSDFWFRINGTRYEYKGRELTAYYDQVISGIPDVMELKASIYPNPVTNGEINIVFDLADGRDEIAILIYDVLAKVVYTNTFQNTFGKCKVSGLDHLEKGIYLLEVSSSSQSKVFKILF